MLQAAAVREHGEREGCASLCHDLEAALEERTEGVEQDLATGGVDFRPLASAQLALLSVLECARRAAAGAQRQC